MCRKLVPRLDGFCWRKSILVANTTFRTATVTATKHGSHAGAGIIFPVPYGPFEIGRYILRLGLHLSGAMVVPRFVNT